MAIKIDHLDYCISDKQILSDISLEFHSGQHIGLVGANGAGKSTLLNLLSRGLTPESGEILWQGKVSTDWDEQSFARYLAVLPQSSSLSFGFSVLEVILLGMLNTDLGHKQQLDIANDLMHTMGLSQYRDKAYTQLSGGEKQRVHFARVCAQLSTTPINERILLLDEPTSALDLNHQKILMDQAQGMAKQGACVVSVIHDLNLASRYCDRLVMLADGAIVADGCPEEVINEDNIFKVFNYQARLLNDEQSGLKMVV